MEANKKQDEQKLRAHRDNRAAYTSPLRRSICPRLILNDAFDSLKSLSASETDFSEIQRAVAIPQREDGIPQNP